MSNADIIRLVLAALFGAAASFIATAAKATRDEQRDLCNQFAEAVLKAADLGAEYWLLPVTDLKAALLQARIMGAQSYLARYRVLALDWFSPDDKEKIIEQLATFYDALTGGRFKGARRQVEPNRAELCQETAALLAVNVKAANVRSLKLRSMIARMMRWHNVTRYLSDHLTLKPPERLE